MSLYIVIEWRNIVYHILLKYFVLKETWRCLGFSKINYYQLKLHVSYTGKWAFLFRFCCGVPSLGLFSLVLHVWRVVLYFRKTILIRSFKKFSLHFVSILFRVQLDDFSLEFHTISWTTQVRVVCVIASFALPKTSFLYLLRHVSYYSSGRTKFSRHIKRMISFLSDFIKVCADSSYYRKNE